MVLNDWQRGKLPFFVPPPGCALEPKPDGLADDDKDEAEEEDAAEDDDEEDVDDGEDGDDTVAAEEEDDEASDTETNYTTDTTQTNDTLQTTDSLFENVKFKDFDEQGSSSVLPGSGRNTPRRPPVNLQDLVKQNFKKIVPSVDYFDEEKFEGGRKKKKATAAPTPTPPKIDEVEKQADSLSEIAKVESVAAPEEEEKSEKEATIVGSQQPEISSPAESKTSKRKTPASAPSSSKKSKAAIATKKTVKTKSGTFSVTDVS